MLTPSQNPYSYQHQEKAIGRTFSLLCWNIHKENMDPHFHPKLHKLLLGHPSDFLLFQEYKMPKHQPHDLKAFSYAMAANIETRHHIYGLLTASMSSFDARKTALTHQKEFFISTRKSILLTSHTFSDGEILHMVNMHGINFVSSKVFSKELEKTEALLKEYSGALILSGDFNNWNKKRIKALEEFQETLSLQRAVIEEEHHIKQVFSKPIDHIFYRGLKLVHAKAIDTKKVSDHNPIYAIFEKL